jgi:inosine-uridine nucleoside N-ribohydrolase
VKVIIDTDPGTDDAIALIMALNSPNLDIVGLTTVGGNASLDQTTRNALRLLEYMNRPEIPVSKGASRPIRGEFDYAYYHHGPGGLTVELPAPSNKPIAIPAPDFIIRESQNHAGNLTLIAIGPLTNVANAITKEPRLNELINEVIVMGGAVEVGGNVTPYAEFNIYDDPDAASIVFSSGIPIRLIGLDVCNETYVTTKDESWLSLESHGGKLASQILANWFDSRDDSAIYHLCDPLAIAAAIQPDLMTYRQASVMVESEDATRKGQTTANYSASGVRIALSVKAPEAKDLMLGLLKG